MYVQVTITVPWHIRLRDNTLILRTLVLRCIRFLLLAFRDIAPLPFKIIREHTIPVRANLAANFSLIRLILRYVMGDLTREIKLS